MHSGFAIRRVSTSPLSQYLHANIFAMVANTDFKELKNRLDIISLKIDGLCALVATSLEKRRASVTNARLKHSD